MPHIDDIPLPEVKVVSLSGAPVGTLVQIAGNDLPIKGGGDGIIVALRSGLETASGTSVGLVLLEGAVAGTFLSDADLAQRPALDINAIASIVVRGPAPRLLSMLNQPKAGDVWLAQIRNDRTFQGMAVKFNGNDPAVVGYVELEGANRGRITKGQVQYYLGKIAVVSKNLI